MRVSAAKGGRGAGKRDVAAEQWHRYSRARDRGHVEYMERARLHDAYYRGEQWRQRDVLELEAADRPALTINMIAPTINSMIAEHSSKRADVRFKPRKDADQELADTLTRVYEQIADASGVEWAESQVFSDGLIMDGRGYFDVRMSYEENWRGEVAITALDPLDVIPDPDAKDYDPDTWTEVFISRWWTLDDVDAMYGPAMREKVRMAQHPASEDSLYYEERFGSNWSNESLTGMGVGREDRRVRMMRIVERQYRKMARVNMLLDPMTGEERQVPSAWDQERLNAFVARNGYEVFERRQPRVRWTVTCGDVVLHDDWSPYDHFTVVPYFAYFRRGNPFGVVRNLISSQDQLNKISSQELHVINTTANSGWIFESGSLVGKDADDLAEQGAATGLVLEVAPNVDNMPQKIQPNPVPPGLAQAAAKSAAQIKEISGVSDAALGAAAEPRVSGVAITEARASASHLLQVPLENLRRTRTMLAERVLNLVQRYYNEERIIYVADRADPSGAKVPMRVNQPTPEGRILNDLTLGEYDVVVGTAPARDTFDEVQFAEALALRGAGVMVPDDAIIGYSHLEDKAELAKRLRIMQGVEQTPEQQEMARIQAELEMQAAQLALEEQEAKVQKLEAEAHLAMAKAGELGTKPGLDVMRERAKLEQHRQMMALRQRLAELSAHVQIFQSQQSSGSKMGVAAVDAAARERVARITAQARDAMATQENRK